MNQRHRRRRRFERKEGKQAVRGRPLLRMRGAHRDQEAKIDGFASRNGRPRCAAAAAGSGTALSEL